MIPETNMVSLSDSMSKCVNQRLGGTGKWNFKWWGKCFSATSKKQNPSKVAGGTWLKRLLFLCVVGSIMGSLCIFHYMNAGIVKRREDLLKSMCDERTRMLVDQFNVSMNHIHALALLVSTFHLRKQPSSIDQETFANFAEQTAFERPLTTGVSYAQRVLHSEREQFEKEQGWQILKMPKDCNDSLDPCESEYEVAPVQDEYAPVIFSQKTVKKIHKCDVMSGKVRKSIFLCCFKSLTFHRLYQVVLTP